MGFQRLFRILVALVVGSVSVAALSTAAIAAPDDLFGIDVQFSAVGSPVGVFDAQYLTLQGDGTLNLALFGHDFTQASSQEMTVHKGTCATPGLEIDRFEVDPLLRVLPLDPNPIATSLLGTLLEGTPGALRYESGTVVTSIAVEDVASFELEYVIIVNEIGSGAPDYFCGTPSDRTSLGASSGAGTVYPLFFKELNGSGVSATGSATLIGNILTLDLSYEGLTNLVGAHFQLLRQGAVCPTGATATELEIEGTVQLALTEGTRSLLPVDVLTGDSFLVHPIAGVDGKLDYLAQIALTDEQVSAFANSSILIHGFDANDNGLVDGGVSPIAPALVGDETAVAGCGQFTPLPAGAPTDASASVTGTDLTVSWTAPVDDGGSPVLTYTVALSNGDQETVTAATTTATFLGLDDGIYTATVIATNAGGDSPASEPTAEVTIDSTTTPAAPAAPTATVEDTTITVTWDAPANDGGSAITGYTVSLSNGDEEIVDGTTLTATFAGIADGDYTATVTATNINGDSDPSAPSAEVTVDTTTVAAAPSNVVAVVTGPDATVTWAAPADDGGREITGYTVTLSDGSELTVDGLTLSATFLLLPNGAYTATVTATNINGNSDPSAVSNEFTVDSITTVPTRPGNVTAAATDDDITVTWEAPVDNGGQEITSYSVLLSDGTEKTVDSPALTTTFAGVEDGIYTATVVATTSIGDSPTSEVSNEVTVDTRTVPGQATGVTAVFERPDLVVSWTEPVDDGGSPILSYTVTLSDGTEATVGPETTQALFEDIPEGSYTATVAATNAIGDSPATEPTAEIVVIPLPEPGKPLNISVRAVGTKVIVKWDPPANAVEAQVQGYEVLLSNGAVATVSGTAVEFTGQEPGELTAIVLAFNIEGSSQASVPSAPVMVRDCQDGDVDIDWDDRVATAEEGALFRLYCGYFLRYPDAEGFAYWKSIQDGGADLSTISDLFATSKEFDLTYGQLNNDEFVRLLYRNVLLRPVEPEGYEYWKGFLDREELTQGGTMRWVSQSQEFQNVTGTP